MSNKVILSALEILIKYIKIFSKDIFFQAKNSQSKELFLYRILKKKKKKCFEREPQKRFCSPGLHPPLTSEIRSEFTVGLSLH